MFRPFIIAALLCAPALAHAQDGQTGTPPDRVREVTLQPNEKCPAPVGNEVVVCRTLEEPYRIPKRFRDAGPTAANQSWTNRAATLDMVSREAGGLPNTCSPIGTGGQTGCNQQDISNWYAEKRAQAAEGSGTP